MRTPKPEKKLEPHFTPETGPHPEPGLEVETVPTPEMVQPRQQSWPKTPESGKDPEPGLEPGQVPHLEPEPEADI